MVPLRSPKVEIDDTAEAC
jgi:hypothetical protein